MDLKDIKAIQQSYTNRPLLSWEQPLNIESLLKAWLNFNNKKPDRINKGKFGEAFCREIFINHFGYSYKYSNYRTPYGELDLVFESAAKVALALEVKLIFSDQEDHEIWSFSQRKRFLKSTHFYSVKHQASIDYGLFLIKKDFISYLSSQDLFL